jgi:hypothetical protein
MRRIIYLILLIFLSTSVSALFNTEEQNSFIYLKNTQINCTNCTLQNTTIYINNFTNQTVTIENSYSFLLSSNESLNVTNGKNITLQGDGNITVRQSGNLLFWSLVGNFTGPQGPQGPTGGTGPQGPPGTNGTDGVNGSQGIPGVNGTNGANYTLFLGNETHSNNVSNGSTIRIKGSTWIGAFLDGLNISITLLFNPQDFNFSAMIQAVNNSLWANKLNTSDQRYNDTGLFLALNQTKGAVGFSYKDCTTANQFLTNLSVNLSNTSLFVNGVCANATASGSSDGNNYTTGINMSVTGNVLTLQMNRSGMPSLFTNVTLPSGNSTTINQTINASSFTYYNSDTMTFFSTVSTLQTWTAQPAVEYPIFGGSTSAVTQENTTIIAVNMTDIVGFYWAIFQNVTGNASARLYIKYSVNNGTTWTNLSNTSGCVIEGQNRSRSLKISEDCTVNYSTNWGNNKTLLNIYGRQGGILSPAYKNAQITLVRRTNLTATVTNTIQTNITVNSNLSSIQTWSGNSLTDEDTSFNGDRDRWQWLDKGTSGSAMKGIPIFDFNFNSMFLNETYGHWSGAYNCDFLNSSDCSWGSLAIGVPFKKENVTTKMRTFARIRGDYGSAIGTCYANQPGIINNITIGMNTNTGTVVNFSVFYVNSTMSGWQEYQSGVIDVSVGTLGNPSPFWKLWVVIAENTSNSALPMLGCLDVESIGVEQWIG